MYRLVQRNCAQCGEPYMAPKPTSRFCSKSCSGMRGAPGDRFFAKVNTSGPVPAHAPELGPCHVWRGLPATGALRYGSFRFNDKPERSHRGAFFLAEGRWPQPMALHRCDNRACVRRSHLFEGDDADNMRDREAKGRGRQPKGEANGHAKLTEEDVRAIRASNESQRALARRYGVSRPVIKAAITRKTWRHVA